MTLDAPPPTYLSEAKSISFVFNRYREMTEEVLREGSAEDLRIFREYRELLPFLRRAERFFEGRPGFAPGVTVSQLTRLSDRVLDFRDVPKGHWASEAIRELRALGLIEGYPGGRFGG